METVLAHHAVIAEVDDVHLAAARLEEPIERVEHQVGIVDFFEHRIGHDDVEGAGSDFAADLLDALRHRYRSGVGR